MATKQAYLHGVPNVLVALVQVVQKIVRKTRLITEKLIILVLLWKKEICFKLFGGYNTFCGLVALENVREI